MEAYLRLGLLAIAIVICILMFIESRSRRKPEKDNFENSDPVFTEVEHTMAPELTVKTVKPISAPVRPRANNLLVISVIAKPFCQFASYDLLQAISATGMQFGDMNIFHCQQVTEGQPITLFSLASATEPGEFNLDRMGDYSCLGLTLFMDLSRVPKPKYAFELMYNTAMQLSEDLDGELRAGYLNPWSDEVLQHYRHIVANYSTTEA